MKNKFTAGDRTPYTYLISFPLIGKVYYGVKYGKRCHPDDLGKTYHSSSGIVHNHIDQQGLQNVIFEIRQVFTDIEKAKAWETKVLQKFDARHDQRFLNKHNNDGLYPADNSGTNNPMYGTISPFKGRRHTEESIAKIRLANKDKVLSTEHKAKLSFTGKKHSQEMLDHFKETRSGEKNGFYGKKHSQETFDKIKQTKSKGWYHTPHGKFMIPGDGARHDISYAAIGRWCTNSDKIISSRSICQSSYLKAEDLGKTFKEIGFWFESSKPL